MSYKLIVLLKPTEEQVALQRAADFAKFMPDLQVCALRVINNYTQEQKDSLLHIAQREIEAYAQKYNTIKNFSTLVVFNENVSKAFCQVAKEGQYDLAIISANKRDTFKDLFINTIDYDILRHISIPLLIVKDKNAPHKLNEDIIVAINFQEDNHDYSLDELLVAKTKIFAENFNGKIHIANCVAPESQGIMGAKLDLPKMMGGGEHKITSYYNTVVNFAKEHGLDESNTHVLEGRIDEEIPRLARKLEARMVCMSIARVNSFFGSIDSSASEIVLEHIKGDIFIVNSNCQR